MNEPADSNDRVQIAEAESVRLRVLVGFSLEGLPAGADVLAEVDALLTQASVDRQQAAKRPANPTNYDQFWMGGGWRRLERASVNDPPPVTAHRHYSEDYLSHVQSFLFDGTGAAGTAYWRWSETIATNWFKGSAWSVQSAKAPFPGPDAVQSDGQALVSLTNDSGVELFVSRLGIGVLSLSLDLNQPVGLQSLLQLNHALATGQQYVWFVKPGFPGYDRQDNRPPDFERRLTKGKHAFHFAELAEWLLSPLKEKYELSVQPRNWIYCCLHLSREWDFKDEARHDAAAKALSHLSQIHPPSHPGEVDTEEFGESLSINSRHLVSVGLAGAAHAIARQPHAGEGDNPNDGRQRWRGHFHYFTGFLLALLQRLALERILHQGRGLIEQRRALQSTGGTLAGDDAGQQLQALDARQSALRWQMLSFCVEAEFVLVSPRRTVQSFHQTAQRVSEIQQGMTTARRALDDWESAREAEAANVSLRAMEEMQRRGEKQSEMMVESLDAIEQMQNKVEWLEVFIVVVYAIEAGHILAAAKSFGHENWFLSGSLLALSAVCGLIGFLVLQPFRHAKKGTLRRMLLLAVLTLAAIGGFLWANHKWNPGKHGRHGDAEEAGVQEPNPEPAASGSAPPLHEPAESGVEHAPP